MNAATVAFDLWFTDPSGSESACCRQSILRTSSRHQDTKLITVLMYNNDMANPKLAHLQALSPRVGPLSQQRRMDQRIARNVIYLTITCDARLAHSQGWNTLPRMRSGSASINCGVNEDALEANAFEQVGRLVSTCNANQLACTIVAWWTAGACGRLNVDTRS